MNETKIIILYFPPRCCLVRKIQQHSRNASDLLRNPERSTLREGENVI